MEIKTLVHNDSNGGIQEFFLWSFTSENKTELGNEAYLEFFGKWELKTNFKWIKNSIKWE